MNLRVIQWNIGGGKIRHIDSDPTKNAGFLGSSYTDDGFDYIISKLKEWNVDIITMQETHADKNKIQAELIAKKLDFPYWVNDIYDDSHVEEGQNLCQSVISKYPILNNSFQFFKNPNFKTTREDGSVWISHNKGYTSTTITLPGNIDLTVGTTHLVPFRVFEHPYNDSESVHVLNDVSDKIIPSIRDLTLIQGDFNIDDKSLKNYLPEILRNLHEIKLEEPTTPKGRKYDHVLYKGLQLITCKIQADVLTDHYPIISEFELKI